MITARCFSVSCMMAWRTSCRSVDLASRDSIGSSSGISSALSSGIALALNATLFGLLAAIPSLAAWSYYNKKVEGLAVEMAALCDQFLIRQYHRDDERESEEAPARRRP